MTLIDKSILKDIFTAIMKATNFFEYEEGSPFMCTYNGRDFFVYLKNITPGYFNNRPDVTRVQLPYRPHYTRILDSDVSFVILGYDKVNEIFVNWSPLIIKKRLNSKSNVSLYSRYSLQDEVLDGEIKEVHNINGDKMVLFKKNMLPVFFNTIDSIYINEAQDTSLFPADLPTEARSVVLSSIDNEQLLSQINPFLTSGQVLKAIEICRRHYHPYYPAMGFKDWFALVNKLFDAQGF